MLDLAGNIGAILMASGMPATATMDQVTAIAAAYGIERCEVDVINTTIHVAAYRGPTLPAGQHAAHRAVPVDGLQPAGGRRPADRPDSRGPGVRRRTARDELDAIITAPHPYKRWVATLAWGALAFATAGTLGAGLLACLVSALSAMTIDRVNRRLNRHGLPFFFQYAVGGAIATAPPLVLYWLSPKLGLNFEPTVAIAAGLVVLLAGLSLVGSVGDVITGAPGHGRGPVLRVGHDDGRDDRRRGPGAASRQPLRRAVRRHRRASTARTGRAARPRRIRRGERGGLRAGLLCRTVRGGGSGVRRRRGHHRVPARSGRRVWAPSWRRSSPRCRSGLVGRLMERRNLAPPLVVSIAGIVPLLPGLALLHGIYAILNDQHAVGFASVLGALAVGTALAAGVTLGEWSSWKVRRRSIQLRRRRVPLGAESRDR